MSEVKKKHFYSTFIFKYSLFFAICSFLAFMWFFLNGRTFIWIHDGYNQHYKALLFYGDYLRLIIRSIFSGRFSDIPSWSYFLGEGGDILLTLNYYVVGDPLNLLSVFFGESNMHILYTALSIIRLYLAGLSFSYLCRYFKISNDTAISISAVSYAFCLWGIHSAAHQVIFLSPLIYLPLLIVGADKTIKNQKNILLPIAVFLSAITNFYHFYNLVLMVVIYVAIRVITLHGKDYKKYILPIRNMFIESIIGVLMSGVVLLPLLIAFRGDYRSSIDFGLKLFYPGEYYLSLPSIILSPNMMYSYTICLAAPIIVGLSLMFIKSEKGTKLLRTIWIVIGVLCLFPFFGQIFNGFSYVSGRWSFAVALCSSFTLAYMWDSIKEEVKNHKKFFGILILILGVLCFAISYNRIPRTISSVIIFAVFVLVFTFVLPKESSRTKDVFLIGFVLVSVMMSALWIDSFGGDNYAAEDRRPSEIFEDNNNDEAAIILSNSGNEFIRYTGLGCNRNWGLIRNISTIGYFWTNSNPDVVQFNSDLDMTNYKYYEYNDYDGRTIPTLFSSARYYVVNNDRVEDPQGVIIPYSFESVSDISNDVINIYESQSALGFTFSSTSVLSMDDWNNANAIEREAMLLDSVVVDSVPDNLSVIRPSISIESLPYDVSLDEADIVCDENLNRIEVTSNVQTMTLNFEGVPSSETYLCIRGLSFDDGNDGYDAPLVIAGSNGVIKTQEFYEDGYDYYNGRRDFIVNLGYEDEPLEFIKIIFICSGDYTFDEIGVYCQDVSRVEDAVARLSEVTLQNVNQSADYISGDWNSTEDRVLVFSIPYSEGWTAYIDGQKVDTLRANIKYIGISVPSGEHRVELKYHTPYQNFGLVLSVVGVVLFFFVFGKKSGTKSNLKKTNSKDC